MDVILIMLGIVFGVLSFPKKVDMHKVAIMDDGTEINY